MNPPPNTARLAHLAAIIWRLKRQYANGVLLPGGLPLSWSQYARLVAAALAEYGREEP